MKRIISGIMMILLFLGILLPSINSSTGQETRVIKILDAQTGSSSIALGNETKPMPPEGCPFTVNVTLEGVTNSLFTYQVAVKFDRTRVRCIAAWINRNDPSFVFYNYRVEAVIVDADIENYYGYGYVVLGASLTFHTVNVATKGLLCQINFTAIKTGVSALEIIPTGSTEYPDDTFLWEKTDEEPQYVEFDSSSFSFSVTATSSPPVASFIFNPSNPRANQNVTFDASESYDPDGEIVSYFWDFGDGNNATSTNATVTHAFALTGAYLVNLTVFDNDGLNNSIVHEILLGRPPYVNFTYDWERKDEYPLNPYGFNRTATTFNATASFDPDGYITLYAWNFSLLKPHYEETTVSYVTVESLNETTTNATLNHNFTQNGVYHVKLTVFDNDGLHNSTAQYIFVGKRPVAEFTYSPQNPLIDEVVTFNASESQVGDSYDHIVLYVWDFSDYNITETMSSQIEHTYIIAEGDYPVNLTVYDNNGLYNSTVQIVKVKISEGTIGANYIMYIVAGITVVAVAIVVAAILLKRKKYAHARHRKGSRKV